VKENEMNGDVARMEIRMHIGYWWESQKERNSRKTKTYLVDNIEIEL
jgi:hypothetical protein